MKTFSRTRAFLSLFYLCIFLISVYDAQMTESYGQTAGEWKAIYEITENPFVVMRNNVQNIRLIIYDINLNKSNTEFYFEWRSQDANFPVISSRVRRGDFIAAFNGTNGLAHWYGSLGILSENTGASLIYLALTTGMADFEETNNISLNVVVRKLTSLHERIFQLASGAIILFMFINLGTVLDLQRLKRIVMFPVGPAVAFSSRYIIMPALGLAFGFLCFRDDKNSQLAVFFAMLSPSGGIANICNFFMRGNIDLAIAATTLNSLMTLAMFPIWIIFLGSVVYGRTGLVVPFTSLAVSFVGILLALVAGISLRLCFPKGTVRIIRVLKPISVVLSLLLVAVTVAVHIITFRYFTPLMCLAAIVLPLVSYFVTYGIAKCACMESNDAMTISLETGVMNMTVPILLLNASLETADANKVLALPITCALMSLVYVALFYMKRHFLNWQEKSDDIMNAKSKMYVAK